MYKRFLLFKYIINQIIFKWVESNKEIRVAENLGKIKNKITRKEVVQLPQVLQFIIDRNKKYFFNHLSSYANKRISDVVSHDEKLELKGGFA